MPGGDFPRVTFQGGGKIPGEEFSYGVFFWDGIFLGGNFPGDNFLGEIFRWKLSGGYFPRGGEFSRGETSQGRGIFRRRVFLEPLL